MTAKSEGTWSARYQFDDGKRKSIALGDYSGLPRHQRYDVAKREAETWFAHIDQGGAVERATLRDACEAYADSLEARGDLGRRAAADVRRRFSQYVFDDLRFSGKELGKLTRQDFIAWRQKLTTMPTKKGAVRKANTLNRDMTCLRAALNFAKELSWVTTDVAWKGPLKPISVRENPEVQGRRELYLSRVERRRLVTQATTDLQLFIQAMCLLPLRPGALAALRVRDFDRSRALLIIREDKAGRGRIVPLPNHVFRLIKSLCSSKLPKAHIFTRSDGTPWNKDNWKKPLRQTAQQADLPGNIVMYTLRHSVITDLVQAGVPLLTIAQLAGTSVRMVEQHYGHLRQDAALAALAELTV